MPFAEERDRQREEKHKTTNIQFTNLFSSVTSQFKQSTELAPNSLFNLSQTAGNFEDTSIIETYYNR